MRTAEEIQQNLEEINDVARQNSAQTEQTLSASKELLELSAQLRRLISRNL